MVYFGCHLVNPHVHCPGSSEYVWQRGVGSQKCLFMGNFQSVPCYRKRTDQKPPINRHFWIPTPLWHTYSEPSWHEDSPGPPLPPQKMHPELPRNKYFSSFGQLWVIKSPPYLKRATCSKLKVAIKSFKKLSAFIQVHSSTPRVEHKPIGLSKELLEY